MCLDLLNLLADHDRIVAADFLRAQLPVVERTVVLVRISVDGAEQTSAPALETGEADLLAAHPASVLLFAFAVILVVLFVVRGGGGFGTRTGSCRTLFRFFSKETISTIHHGTAVGGCGAVLRGCGHC